MHAIAQHSTILQWEYTMVDENDNRTTMHYDDRQRRRHRVRALLFCRTFPCCHTYVCDAVHSHWNRRTKKIGRGHCYHEFETLLSRCLRANKFPPTVFRWICENEYLFVCVCIFSMSVVVWKSTLRNMCLAMPCHTSRHLSGCCKHFKYKTRQSLMSWVQARAAQGTSQ